MWTHPLTITADVVAWYAAIVATISVAVNAYGAWRDRSHLVVTARSGYRVTAGAHGYSPEKLYISVTVANRGRRPATVSHVWLDVKGMEEKILLNDSLLHGSRELKEGAATTYALDQSSVQLENVNYVYAGDQTGRKWRGRLKK
jgi:hypothetical protein